MATTLDAGTNTPPVVRKGHGTAALGPSDSSDSGSDIQGGPGLDREDGGAASAAADIGDANLDSDTDRNGTGERGAVGRDATSPVDTLLRDDQDRIVDGESVNAANVSTESPDDERDGHPGAEVRTTVADTARDPSRATRK